MRVQTSFLAFALCGVLATTTEEVPYLVLHAWYYFDNFTEFVDVGAAAGFNAIRVTADWGAMETTPGNIDFSQLDARLDYVISTKKLPAIISIWTRRPNSGDDPVLARTEEMANSTGSFVQVQNKNTNKTCN